MKKKLLYIIVSAMLLLILASCGASSGTGSSSATSAPSQSTGTSQTSASSSADKTAAPEAGTPSPDSGEAEKTGNVVNIEIEMEDGGIIKAELYPDIAPITVENFVKLCNENFFDGLTFHRVIPGFMIQGGGFDKDKNQKPADPIKGEFAANGVKNDLKHTRGVLSMARTQVPDSASSQFFIMHDAAPHLDGQYAAFGKVTDGMDVVDKIAQTETESVDIMFQNCPKVPQVIKNIRVVEGE